MYHALAGPSVSQHSLACKNCWLNPLCHSGYSHSGLIFDLTLLARHASSVVNKGMVFMQNAPFSTYFIVRSGAVKTFHVNERRDEKILAFYLPGQMFGFDGIASGVHTCSAIALERSQLCRLSIRQMEELGRVSPELAYGVLKALSSELNGAERLNRWLSQSTAEERVVGFLLDIARRYRQCHLRDTDFRLAMARSDIANYLGLALATVSRILARLHRDHLIEVHGRNVQLLQVQQLKARVCADDYEEKDLPHFSGVHHAAINRNLSVSH